MGFINTKRVFLIPTNLVFLLLFLFKPIFSSSSSSVALDFLRFGQTPEVFDWMVDVRRRIHENPELGYQEFQTSKLITEELEKLGIEYRHPAGGTTTGVVGLIGSGKPPFVAIRADLDALPLQETVEWEHKSKNDGKMHASGNDAHVAMVLGAARILRDHPDTFKGTVVLVFQPAGEGGGGGAKKMIEGGVLENVEAIFGLHAHPRLPVGHVECRPGPVAAGRGRFEAQITGKGGHAAIPQQSIDPILAGSNVIVSLQQLVSRESDPLDSTVLTVAKFHGGGSFNVIPDYVTIGGTFRSFSTQTLYNLKQRIEEVIIRQAAVQRCNATVTFNSVDQPLYPPTVNDKNLHILFEKVAKDMLGPDRAKYAQPMMGIEDFSFYQQLIPGYFFMLGMKDETTQDPADVRSPDFRIHENALPVGAALQASLAVQFLRERSELASPAYNKNHHDEL